MILKVHSKSFPIIDLYHDTLLTKLQLFQRSEIVSLIIEKGKLLNEKLRVFFLIQTRILKNRITKIHPQTNSKYSYPVKGDSG